MSQAGVFEGRRRDGRGGKNKKSVRNVAIVIVYRAGFRIGEIARAVGVSRQAVWVIVNRDGWMVECGEVPSGAHEVAMVLMRRLLERRDQRGYGVRVGGRYE